MTAIGPPFDTVAVFIAAGLMLALIPEFMVYRRPAVEALSR